MTIREQINATKEMMNTLTLLTDEIDWVVESLEEKSELTEADEKLLQFAKHLQKKYQ